MVLSEMKTKDYVEIWIGCKDGEDLKFRSRVELSTPEYSVVLAPLSKVGWHPVHTGQHIVIIHCREGKVNRFVCKVVGHSQQGNTKLIHITADRPGEEFNRRQYYRIGTILDVEVSYTSSDGAKTVKALCTNISGCGMGIRIPKVVDLHASYAISVKAKIEDTDFVSYCKIARREETLDEVYPYYIGVYFENLKMPELHTLLKYVNSCQRRMLAMRSGTA